VPLHVGKSLEMGSSVYLASRSVTIEHVTMQDRGTYICRHGQDPHIASNITITVHKNPFLIISPPKRPVHEVNEGRRDLKLSARVHAFPEPQVTWYKDGKLIGVDHTCCEPSPNNYSLVIRSPRRKDAGTYTLVLSSSRHGLLKSVNFTVLVNGKCRYG
ncbi:hypothetical protein FKM82_021952, partial [Ascaphus truei]